MFIKTFYTPEIPATIISPDALSRQSSCAGYQTYFSLIDKKARLQLIDCSPERRLISFQLQLIRGLLFTDSLMIPTPEEHKSATLPDDPSKPVPDFNSLL